MLGDGQLIVGDSGVGPASLCIGQRIAVAVKSFASAGAVVGATLVAAGAVLVITVTATSPPVVRAAGAVVVITVTAGSPLLVGGAVDVAAPHADRDNAMATVVTDGSLRLIRRR